MLTSLWPFATTPCTSDGTATTSADQPPPAKGEQDPAQPGEDFESVSETPMTLVLCARGERTDDAGNAANSSATVVTIETTEEQVDDRLPQIWEDAREDDGDASRVRVFPFLCFPCAQKTAVESAGVAIRLALAEDEAARDAIRRNFAFDDVDGADLSVVNQFLERWCQPLREADCRIDFGHDCPAAKIRNALSAARERGAKWRDEDIRKYVLPIVLSRVYQVADELYDSVVVIYDPLFDTDGPFPSKEFPGKSVAVVEEMSTYYNLAGAEARLADMIDEALGTQVERSKVGKWIRIPLTE